MIPAFLYDPPVVAIWIGGSLASGTGDRYSDIDFRIAVKHSSLDAWENPNWEEFMPLSVCGASFRKFGDSALLHHMVTDNGTIFDFYVQVTGEMNFEPALTVIGCRDPLFSETLESFRRPPAPIVQEVDPSVIRRLFVDYWITTHKELKGLGRNYALSSFVGLYHERLALLRAWFIKQTGMDIVGRATIHLLAHINDALRENLTAEQVCLLGSSTNTAKETIAAIESVRNEMSQTGRILAARYGFEYPTDLEKVVREIWKREITLLTTASNETSN